MKQILLILALMTTFFVGSSQIQNYAVGETVDNFTVTDINGISHNLYNYTATGKHVFINFFIVASTPSQVTLKHYNQLHDHYGCNQVDMICISINGGIDDNAAVSNFFSSHGGLYEHTPAVSEDGGASAVRENFNPQGYPTYCLIGADNKLLHKNIWPALSLADFQSAFPAGFSPEVNPCTVGTNDVQTEKNNAVVSPNPVSEELRISFSNTDLKNASLNIYNLRGDTVATYRNLSFSEKLVIPVHELIEGLYMANIRTENGKQDIIQFMVIR
jgi:hypothetical protein